LQCFDHQEQGAQLALFEPGAQAVAQLFHAECSQRVWIQPQVDQRLACQLLDPPQDCPLLLFGAMGGGKGPRKGMDLLLAALAHLRSEPSLQSMQLLVFGQLAPQAPPQLGFPVHYTGQEAHACGTPVVAFITSGLRDIVADRVTGAVP
jgi:hypothetical protein